MSHRVDPFSLRELDEPFLLDIACGEKHLSPDNGSRKELRLAVQSHVSSEQQKKTFDLS